MIMFKDARDYQILFLALFLGLGVALRDWSLRPDIVGIAVITALGTQLVLGWLVGGWYKVRLAESSLVEAPSVEDLSSKAPLVGNPWLMGFNWRSPLITGLGMSLLLRTDHPETMGLAVAVAIASKFCLKVNDKHIFNPGNLGIVFALWFTHDAWVSPGQWGEDLWYGILFLGAGGLVLKRVGRWDTTACFLGSYALLEAVRNLYLGWTWDVWLHRMSSGSLLLFALFMITDPRSIPNARPARLIWALAIAGLTFVLRNQFFVPTAVFWALFALAPMTVLLDYVWESPRFEWQGFGYAQPLGKLRSAAKLRSVAR
jgi:Na+-transporting NADH:ubiquinone oxidoreductase subunit NqrB